VNRESPLYKIGGNREEKNHTGLRLKFQELMLKEIARR
jgi:hypothetical protein